MARAKYVALPTPNYGDLKPQVIAFLHELLLKAHKPQQAIGIWSKDGVRRLGIVCVRCHQYVIVPAEGAIEVPWCAPPAEEKGAAK